MSEVTEVADPIRDDTTESEVVIEAFIPTENAWSIKIKSASPYSSNEIPETTDHFELLDPGTYYEQDIMNCLGYNEGEVKLAGTWSLPPNEYRKYFPVVVEGDTPDIVAIQIYVVHLRSVIVYGQDVWHGDLDKGYSWSDEDDDIESESECSYDSWDAI